MKNFLLKIWDWVRSTGLDKNRLAQIGHLLAGIVTADWVGGWGCLVFFSAWVFPKEVFIDPRPPENGPFFWEGARDMGFYCLGMAVGLVRRLILYKSFV